MTMVGIVEVASAAGSGALVAAAKFLWDIRNDARSAMQILTGHESIERDGLVHQVEDHSTLIEGNQRAIQETQTRIERVEEEVGA